MARIAGVNLPREKRVEIGLTYIFGIGRSTSQSVLGSLEIDRDTKVRDLTEEEVSKLRGYIAEGTSRPNTGGRPGRLLEYDLSRTIGTTIDGGKTSRIRIVVSDDNQVITAFPF